MEIEVVGKASTRLTVDFMDLEGDVLTSDTPPQAPHENVVFWSATSAQAPRETTQRLSDRGPASCYASGSTVSRVLLDAPADSSQHSQYTLDLCRPLAHAVPTPISCAGNRSVNAHLYGTTFPTLDTKRQRLGFTQGSSVVPTR